MSQQLAIVVMIDIDAAIKAGNLEGNIYLIDNAEWMGSIGEGTGQLITAVHGTQVNTQMDAQVMNWLTYGIEAPPPSFPQNFNSDHSEFSLSTSSITNSMSGTANKRDLSETCHLIPKIEDITGEAVDKGVLYPAEYGSPSLFSNGLYWSATVNTNMTGLFSYTMHLKLFCPAPRTHGNDGMMGEPVTMTYDSQINVTREYFKNGFIKTPGILPMF